jgi:hypothetical protein
MEPSACLVFITAVAEPDRAFEEHAHNESAADDSREVFLFRLVPSAAALYASSVVYTGGVPCLI